MRTKLKTAVIFGVGLLIGAAVSFLCLGRMNQQQYARSYATGVIEQAFLASELRANRQVELSKRIESNLPGAVLAIHQNTSLQSVPESQSALRSVKHFYEVNGVTIPQEIAPILSDLPSRQ
ncbi:MAG: hypothetical protein DMF69_09900 [Acidobacteria bacterium]|nr:MAG: hypothetical protein DMF69_09900 [Acidobacteriota bacterium]